ncbi:hypothetical protein CS8_054100 [Cupriavidus sp. 8B]
MLAAQVAAYRCAVLDRRLPVFCIERGIPGIQRAFERVQQQVGAGLEVPIEAAVRQVGATHQLADADGFESAIPNLLRGLFQDALPALRFVRL